MKKRLPLITLRPLAWILFLLITASGYAQESLIQGLVIDENGEPLIGVSIQDQKTQKGTISDIDGKFSLETRIGNMLKISYIGYRTVTLAAAKDMRVVMSEDNMKLDEVVVVGYGVQKKVNLTGAVASVKSDEILKAQSANTSNALIGQIPGLIAKQTTGEPGLDGSQIYIRGVATFQGGTSPTYIIDGIERQAEDFARIDPNEIESLNVLKDAASAAIFGMRGANGVILVTTKRGNTGKVHVKYSGNVSIQKPTSLPEFANSTDYARMKNIYMGNTIYTDEEIRKFADGSDPERYPNTDWYKEMLSKNAVQHQHNITVDGQFSGSGFIEMTKEIGGTDGCIKKSGLPGGTTMNDGGHHQMSQIVGFKVQAIGKGAFLIFGSYLGSDNCLLMRLFQSMSIDSFIKLFDNNRGMDISICSLSLYDASNETVH